MIQQQQPEIPKEMRSTVGPLPSAPTEPESGSDAIVLYNRMLDSVRSWGRALLVLGALHFVASGFLSAPWGILLVLVGAASFYFKDAAMFLLYGMTIAWAAIHNLSSGNLLWIGFALLQGYWAFGLFRDFWRFRRVQEAHAAYVATRPAEGAMPPMRAAHIFPWAAFVLGVLVIVGFIGTFAWMVITPTSAVQGNHPVYIVFELLPNLAVVGLAMGLGSFLLRYRPQLVAAIGMLACSLALIGWQALLFLG